MASPATIDRKWYVVDAEGKTLGRLASEVAKVLRGKNKAIFTPHIDTGDYVIVVNADKVKVTGKKLDQKIYYHHSDYIGGMKETTLREMMNKHPERVIEYAVKGMLPKGPLGDVSSFEFSPVLALTDHTAHYRNKVQLPVGLDADGHVVTGFYAGRTHRIVPCPDCKLQPEWMNALARRACALLEANGIAPYDEETGKGRVRHLYMRQGWHSGQRLLCFVVNGNGLPNEAEICRTLQQEFQLTTVLINRNTARTNVILGRDTRTVLGPVVIEYTLAGVPIQMGVHEFYQVNTPAAELLYAKAKEFARLQPDDFLLDLYCGMGTIGLSMKPHCRRLVGVEVVPQAVEGAKTVAAHLGLPPEEADFYCMDAGEAATRLASEGAHPDVIVV